VFRNLILTLLLVYGFLSIMFIRTTIAEKLVQPTVSLELYYVGTFRKSGTLLLTDCYVLNAWWMAMTGSGGFMFSWMPALLNASEYFTDMSILVPYIWVASQPRKPPDKHNDNNNWTDYLYQAIWMLEDLLLHIIGLEIDFIYWYGFILTLCKGIDNSHPQHFELHSKTTDWYETHCNPSVFTVEVNKRYKLRFKFGKQVTSRLLVSLSSNSRKKEVDDIAKLDSDSYHFAIDTCTSEGICKHKELFIGKIRPCKNVYVQGVGGKIDVQGYGTIKIRITDDDGVKHDLIIHNVLYVPDSPANLLSPQRWSQGSNAGIGEITVEGSTLLFWNDRKATKLIPHHPEMGIPIMSVNDGYTKSHAMLNTCFCKPCMPTFLHTSEPKQQKNSTVHVVPLDDDEESYHNIDKTQQQPLLIDEYEMKESQIRESTAPHVNVIENIDSIETNYRNFEDLGFDVADEESTVFHDVTLDDDNNTIHLDETSSNQSMNEISIPETEIETITKAIESTISPDQQELMAIHWKMKHLPFSDIKRLAEVGAIPKRLAKVKPPLCPSCLMGRQHRKPWRGRGKKERRSIRQPEDNFAGANTSTDQMVSPSGGLIPQLKGKLMRAKYYAATIFVDHHTDYTYVHLMRDTTAESTLEAKHAYERLMRRHRHKVMKYHADNGRYAENLFVQDVRDQGQNITYCGVGSHHQNGIAERRIKSLGEDATTMLAHGQHLWPEVVSKQFWPFAYKAACRARNKFKLDKNGISPEEKLAGVQSKRNIKHEHPLFCPVYTLEKKLQGGIGGIPKWEPKSTAGVYLGHSPEHSSDVALVLDLKSGLVSPQYHVVFDDTFSTVDYIRSAKEPSNWEMLCKYHTENYSIDEDITDSIASDAQRETTEWLEDPVPPEIAPIPSQESTGTPEGDASNPIDLVPQNVSPSEGAEDDTIDDCLPSVLPHNESTNRRSTRERRAPDRFDPSPPANPITAALTYLTTFFVAFPDPVNYYVALKAQLNDRILTYQDRLMNYERMVELNVDGTFNYEHPLAFVTKTGANDTYHFHQAMQEEDRDDFIQAMIKEIGDHENNNHWVLVPRSAIGDAPTVKAIWSFKRKRRPDGSLLKHKARLCAHGGMQVHGVNYWDTYAPVVNWITIRMMLTLSVIHELYTTSIDFTLAFPQADIETTIFMEIPLGCVVPEGDYVCKLLKNVYGIKQAAKTWFEYLRDSFITSKLEGGFGFRQSKVDPCIFYRDGVTIITWVDDCLIFAKNKDLADELLKELQSTFTLTEEDEVAAYLGCQLTMDPTSNTVTIAQPYLIQRIIDLLGDAVRDCNIKDTPTVYKELLHKDEHGPARKQDWNYRSAIGMTNYLAATTRPDIQFAVHQCARFSANPRLSHERAVKRLVRYLKGTNDKGMILKPDKTAGIKCYVDADFAGGYSPATSDEPVSVFSRTGYVIFYMGCPICWVSKMQSEISLSTVEAEYIALSTAMRDIIPLMDQVKEMDLVYGDDSPKPVVKCTIFEDNNGALELARAPRYRPRTKHIAVKYHHFREHVRNGLITIQAIDTKEQIADQFTKGLQVGLFQYLRNKLLHW
jgi:hypothetical protein